MLKCAFRPSLHPATPIAQICGKMQSQLIARSSSRAAVARGVRGVVVVQRPALRSVRVQAWDEDEGPLQPLNQWPEPEFVAATLEAFPEKGLGECSGTGRPGAGRGGSNTIWGEGGGSSSHLPLKILSNLTV